MSLTVLGEITAKNLRFFYRITILACIGILILTAIIFPSAGLSIVEVCKPIEVVISFVGIVTMATAFLQEQDKTIYDSVASRKFNLEIVYFIRVIISSILIVLSVVLYCIYLKLNEWKRKIDS